MSQETFCTAYDALLARWGPGVERLDIPTPYGTTRVNAAGAPGAPPLLLLPGGGDTSASWFANAPEWARTHRVLAVDLIGDTGRSVPAEGRRIAAVDDLNRWLDALLDGLGITRTALAGHSYGAWIALSHALNSARVERLALLDPTNCFAGFRPGYLLRALPMLLRPSPGRVRSFLRWEAGGARLDPDWLRQQEAASGFRTARPVTGPRPDAAGLGAPRIPLLILLAEHGQAHRATAVARTAAARLPHAQIALLPAGHHGLQHQAPDELNAAVGEFLIRDTAPND
ncbi:Carboxylesterase YbfK [Streptomyces sp. YIM 130001]|uniref:alpha/beta fold hydrolase n=1 Tax=Streptomyces sp. YIM 130001 TaxID=2259644 RepID=UPI000EE3DBFB|nr:alpha/beta hydrolase [Streptomyces sp. YIM 130001]RII15659.1 Carboxylesterase YbfK [Streptomyces sp. YIM 130001]